MRLLLRILLTLLGGAVAAFVVALLECFSVVRTLGEAGANAAAVPKGAFIAADTGVLAPVTLVIAAVTAFGGLLIEPEGSPTLMEDLIAIRAQPGRRIRAAALTPFIVLAMFVVIMGAARVSKFAVGYGNPAESGFTMAIAAVLMTLVAVAVALAVLPTVWKVLARRAAGTPFADPIVTGGLASVLVIVLLGLGIATGDRGGAGGLPGVGIFAVLARPELDLRPIVYSLTVVALAHIGGKLVHVPAAHRFGAPVSIAAILVVIGLCVRAASALATAPEVADLLEHQTGLGKVSLGLLRKATDRDKDGYSPRFGGGDCDDKAPGVNPTAVEIPGNGIDEDCSGADAPATEDETPPDAAGQPQAANGTGRTYNVVLFTVDTLRADLGFAGYPRPVSPNLDKLAERSTVFERAYSTASYTAKSMGGMMIGKYPAETHRNWDHYTAYGQSNTFLAKRVQSAGVHTLAGHCHYYFSWQQTGYRQGFDTFDNSAIAPGMADNDSSTTSDRMSDLAIKLLKPMDKMAESGKRFFAWFHYFDPHAQYVHHEGAPDFASMQATSPNRNVYDEEVWYTDKHIGRVLDFIASQPWAEDTAIIITADHGEAFSDAHGVKTHGHELWESLVRVPLLLHVPGTPPKKVAPRRSHMDIAPTVLELVGAPAAAAGELRGTSLVADAVAAADAKHAERDVYLDMPEGPYNDVRRAILTGPSPGMKLIHFGGRRYQLFDLAADPGENQDLSGNAETLRPVMERMDGLRARLKEISVVSPHQGR